MPEPPGSLSAVTVVFEAEVPLVELQARSIAQHATRGLFEEYVVIDNTRAGLSPRARQRIRTELGRDGDLLSFTSADTLGVAEDLPASGWRSQQILKLMVARLLTTDHYVVLDAKNHFIASTAHADFFDWSTGRPHGGIHSFEAHPLRPQLEHVAIALGLDPALAVHRFTATVPPVVLDRGVVNAVVADVGGGDPHRFPHEFERVGYTEYFLYSGWQIARGASLDDLVTGRSLASPTVSAGTTGATDVRAVLHRADSSDTRTLAIHRRALAKLSPESVHDLAEFWTDHGLFDTSVDAERFIRRFRIAYMRAMGVERLRERMSR